MWLLLERKVSQPVLLKYDETSLSPKGGVDEGLWRLRRPRATSQGCSRGLSSHPDTCTWFDPYGSLKTGVMGYLIPKEL